MKKFGRLMIIAVLALSLAGCQKKSGELSHVEAGAAAIDQEEYSQALTAFETAISQEENLVLAYRGQGMAFMGLGKYDQAVASFDRALQVIKETRTQTKKDILYYKAAALYRQANYTETIGVCDEILEIASEADAFYLRGTCYLEQNDEKKAEVNFDAAVLANSKDYDLYLNIYESYKEKKLSAKGDEYLQQALQIETSEKEDDYNKARLYYYLGNYTEAQEKLTELITEKNGAALLLMGKICLSLEDPARSASMYEQYISVAGEAPDADTGIALAKIAQEDYDSALTSIQKGLKLDQEQGKQELYYNEIVIYESQRDFDTAREKALEYTTRYPADELGKKEYEFLQSR